MNKKCLVNENRFCLNIINKAFAAFLAIIMVVSIFPLVPIKGEAADIDPRVENAVQLAVNLANDDTHGYSQTNRKGPDYDCSSFVYYCFSQAGFSLSPAWFNTSTMGAALINAGFTEITNIDFSTSNQLVRGDILWKSGHTEIYISNNQRVGAHGDRGYPATGDQTGTEVSVCAYPSSLNWTKVYRYINKTQTPVIHTEKKIYSVGDKAKLMWDATGSDSVHIYIYKDGQKWFEGEYLATGSNYWDCNATGHYSFYLVAHYNGVDVESVWDDYNVISHLPVIHTEKKAYSVGDKAKLMWDATGSDSVHIYIYKDGQKWFEGEYLATGSNYWDCNTTGHYSFYLVAHYNGVDVESVWDDYNVISQLPVIHTEKKAYSVGDKAKLMWDATGSDSVHIYIYKDGQKWFEGEYLATGSNYWDCNIIGQYSFYLVAHYNGFNVESIWDDYSVSDAQLTPPIITAQPATIKQSIGTTAIFNIVASGTGLVYRWQCSTNGGRNWGNSGFSTAKTATLKVPVTEARNGYMFRCVVTGANGSVTSSAAALTVATKITAQPASVTKALGETAAFTVNATGVDLTYKWQYSANGGRNWSNSGFSTAKTATLKVPVTEARNGYMFRCVVTGANGSVTSSAAALTVATKITAQPASVTKALGETATFTVSATGVDLTYKWQYSVNGGRNWGNSGFSTAKTATLKVPVTEARNGYMFRCVVTGSNGQTATSSAAKLTVS